MNPLGIDVQRFLVAEESETGQILGFGQLAQLGRSSALELRSLVVERESRYDDGAPKR